MYIEQIKYFFAIAEAGSISKAAKNLFISQQGMSDALLRLEKELGFPLFVRQKKNIFLTKNGEIFLNYARSFLENYDEMLRFASRASTQYTKKDQEITIMLGPLIAAAMISRLCHTELISRYNLHLYENTISDIDLAFANNQAHLGIFCLDDTQLAALQRNSSNYPDYMELIELFDDEVIYCMHKDHPIAASETIFQHDIKLLIEFTTTYYDYFNTNAAHISTIRMNNIDTHIRLMKENFAVSMATRKLFRLLYPDPDIIVRSFTPPRYCKFYLARNKNLFSNDICILTDNILDIVQSMLASS